MHRACISSVVCGVVLASALQSTTACSIGYIMLQMIVPWARACAQQINLCMFSTDTVTQRKKNEEVFARVQHSSAPRSGATQTPRAAYCALVAIVTGACDGLSLALGQSKADLHVILLAAFIIAGKRMKVLVGVLTLYVYSTLPVPMTYDVARPAVLLLGTILAASIMPAQWIFARIATGSTVVLAFGGLACSTKISSLSPVLVLTVAFYDMRANPVAVLLVAVVIVLWQ